MIKKFFTAFAEPVDEDVLKRAKLDVLSIFPDTVFPFLSVW